MAPRRAEAARTGCRAGTVGRGTVGRGLSGGGRGIRLSSAPSLSSKNCANPGTLIQPWQVFAFRGENEALG